MNNYFEDMLPADELAQVKYIPTIPEFVTWIEGKWKDLPALSDTVNIYKYAQMCDAIARKRALLNALGLAKGDKVAILDNTTVEAVEMFLAVTSAGYVAINLPSQLPAPAVTGCCMKFGVKVLAAGSDFMETAKTAPCTVIAITDMADQKAPVAVVGKDDPAAIFFTGGTTGAPKGAILPHRALMRGALNGVYAPGHQLGCQRYASVLPLSHVFGLIRGTLSVLFEGGAWYAAANTKETISKFPMIKPTCLVAVPGICEILLGLVKMYGKPFLGGNLKFIISGAANVPPKLIGEFDELGISHLVHHTGDMDSSNHLYLIRIPGIDSEIRNRIIEKMAEKGVATNVHYKPLPMMTAYGGDCSGYPNAYDYYHNLITLPFHTLLSDEDVDCVCKTLREVVKEIKG